MADSWDDDGEDPDYKPEWGRRTVPVHWAIWLALRRWLERRKMR